MAPFENFNFVLKKCVTNAKYVSSQVAKRYLLALTMENTKTNYKSYSVVKCVLNLPKPNTVHKCETLSLFTNFLYKISPVEELLLKKHFNCEVKFYKRYENDRGRIYYSKAVASKKESYYYFVGQNVAFEIFVFVQPVLTAAVFGLGKMYELEPFDSLPLSYIKKSYNFFLHIQNINALDETCLQYKFKNKHVFRKFLNSFDNCCDKQELVKV